MTAGDLKPLPALTNLWRYGRADDGRRSSCPRRPKQKKSFRSLRMEALVYGTYRYLLLRLGGNEPLNGAFDDLGVTGFGGTPAA